ncbi:MAG: alpha-D-ribose 1-methylphosphonate 5-triphosphate diphosphatase [Clostridia bacterium]|nr:alpha-D-ribose 1-methylphosphonate 5-triphosphate diphosphatase [Clostridia bacterium]
MRTLIKNGRIVTPDKVLNGSLIIEDGIIMEILEGDDLPSRYAQQTGELEIIEADGLYIMPGLVDLHCDALEQTIQPRKKVFFPIELALQAVQVQFLSAGITSMFHAIALSGEPGLRSNEMAHQIAGEIGKFRKGNASCIRHFTHVRYEIYNETGRETIRKIFEEDLVDLFSVMDHSAKYSRFKDFGQYKAYVEKNSTLSGQMLEKYAKEQWERNEASNAEIENEMIALAKRHGVVIASHDDDSVHRVENYRLKGISISEFPLNESTARYAMESEMYSIVGAPNLFRNKSHAENLSARYAIKNRLANILCSDYYYLSLLPSIFILFEEGMELPEAASYATIHPAKAVGLSDRLGSLEPGKEGDIIMVHHRPGQLPVVRGAMVGGKQVLRDRIRF